MDGGSAVSTTALHHQRAHFATPKDDHLIVDSAELLFRSRGDVNEAATVSCGREDLLRREGDRWKIARRTIFIDESVIRMQNLAIFL